MLFNCQQGSRCTSPFVQRIFIEHCCIADTQVGLKTTIIFNLLIFRGVVTFNGECKNYDITNGYSMASRLAGDGFSIFEGNAVNECQWNVFISAKSVKKC